MLLSLKLKLPKTIFVHGFITVNGQKMSKSLNNIIDPFELVEKYGLDSVRYFLLREIPSSGDGDFTYEKFENRHNSDLANGLGNLVARVLALATKSARVLALATKSKIKSQKLKVGDKAVKKIIKEVQENYKKAMEEIKLYQALEEVWKLVAFCDNYIEQEKPWQPWQITKSQKSKVKSQKLVIILNNLLHCLSEIANLIAPFLPKTSEKIKNQLKTGKSNILFPRI